MTEGLWTAYEAAAATGGALCVRGGDPDHWIAEEWAAQGVSIDTRTLQPGEMFVALQDARDGHEFLQSAFDRGASAALVAHAPSDAPEGAPLLVVSDTLGGLRDLAHAARIRNFGKRIGVTGSVGKTSTKDMLRTALSACGNVHAADKSFNNHWGVPLTLASMPMHSDYGVFEIGMNHAGEITPLTKLVAPHVAIVTTVAPAHLEFFDSVEGIAEAKAEIFLGVVKDGAAVLPADNEHYPLLRKRAEEAGVANIVSFGSKKGADCRLANYEPTENGANISAEILGQKITFTLGAPGKHQAMNALAVLAASSLAGASLETAATALADFGAGAGRGAHKKIELNGATVTVIDESYNANPVSMSASIALLGAAKPTKGGRRIAVLGDMLELGDEAAAFHADLSDHLKVAGVERLYTAGELMENLFAAAPEAMRAGSGRGVAEIAPLLLEDLRDGDIILVKGSNASKVSEIISLLENGRKTG